MFILYANALVEDELSLVSVTVVQMEQGLTQT